MSTEQHRQFYEEEAARRSRRPHEPDSPRGLLRSGFAELVRGEGRRSMVDFGSGPGIDAAHFLGFGIAYVGVDLAVGNAKLAAESGVSVIAGSLLNPPLRERSFDAGWSMSVLMHLPDGDVSAAVTAMVARLNVGAPFTIGTWGSANPRHVLEDDDYPDQRRHYYLRSLDTNVDLVGGVEAAETMDVGPSDWEYHVLRLRAT